MEINNSKSFFANTACEHYPCHKNLDNLNCLFCYCPLYQYDNCPGNYKIIEKDNRKIKSCIDCEFPHKPENYKKIVAIIKSKLHQ